MEGYVGIDRQIDLQVSLEELLTHCRTSFDSARACKWALISAHSALQGAICIALRGKAGFETWKPNHLRRWLEAYEKGEDLPLPQLDFFMELYDKLFSNDSTIDRDLIKWLNETRNGLVHFNTDSYSIAKASIFAAIAEAIKATRQTQDLSNGIFFYEEDQVDSFISLCDEIDEQMASYAAAKQNIPGERPSGHSLIQTSGTMAKLPTDLEIFECIYDMYLAEFRIDTKKESNRSSKIYVPIDLEKVAEKLDSDAHELFGRLYYHLDHKFGYVQENNAHVHLFAPVVGGDRHCINFPYLAAVLADHRQEDKRNKWSLRISLVALGVAIASLLVRFLGS